MAVTAFCSGCSRTVYVEDNGAMVCPVCSSPLVETTVPAEEQAEA